MALRDNALANSKKPILFDEMEVMYDLVFVMNANSKGWILEKICKVIERESSLNCGYLYSERNDKLTYPLPKARAYFFAHYALAFSTMARSPHVFGGDRFVWFTHPDISKGMTLDDMTVMLNLCTHVFTPCTINRRLLTLVGVESSRISVPLGGADPDLFKEHTRGNGKVGFVGAYYQRKMPDKMLELMRCMPHVQFLLVGPGPDDVANRGLLWRAWSRFSELMRLPNLTYVEAPYEEYPRYFNEMDVYVSLSELEGGPIPVIEAMMSNVIPIATRTGFADDVIRHGQTGYVIPIEADVGTISGIVRTALARPEVDVRTSALDYSWSRFAHAILEQMKPRAKEGGQIPFGSAHDPHRFLRQGWHAPDRSGAWTAAASARLAIPLAHAEPGRKILTANLWTGSVSASDTPSVTLRVNGDIVVSKRLPAMNPSEVSGSFELTSEQTAAPLEVTLEVLPMTEVEINGERRALGVKLAWLRFEDSSEAASLAAGVFASDGFERPERRAIPLSNLAIAGASTLSPSTESTDDSHWVHGLRGILTNIGWLQGQSKPKVVHPPASTAPLPADVSMLRQERLSFASGGNAARHLLDGWWEVEPDGVWGRGVDSSLQLWLDPIASNDVELEIEGRVIGARCPGGGIMAVHVHLGGEASSSVDVFFANDDMAMLSVPLPERPLDWAGGVRIVFKRNTSFMPSELDPSSADNRDLGFYLKSIRMTQGEKMRGMKAAE